MQPVGSSTSSYCLQHPVEGEVTHLVYHHNAQSRMLAIQPASIDLFCSRSGDATALPRRPPALLRVCGAVQVDSLPKKIILGVALAYIFLMVILPFVNVFIQVGAACATGKQTLYS